ncbi:hypothetical protein MLD38_011427 [Melastoma candidum]|uniref:Uncharacterized protein n=1 Tax=Melastoma candidum TaxID=119954 RepID=A0ACB9R320_9MYRT|nr:hypothetical protein MLD38_011427 [Melastoma candidum]
MEEIRVQGCPKIRRHEGGIITMPFILANEVCDRLAVTGFFSNMNNYLTTQLHLPSTKAANIYTNFSGMGSLTPLIGAFIADSYAGRFWTIVVASFFYVVGMTILTLSATLPQFRPAPCRLKDPTVPCQEANGYQLAILYVGLTLGAIGAGGIRPCVIAFGADQFGKSGPNSSAKKLKYFNCYYFVMGASVLVAVTLLVYIQDNVGWSVGLGIPTVLMLIATIILLCGYPLYRKQEPSGSPFTRLLQVVVAAFRKRKLAAVLDADLLYGNDDLDASISFGGKLHHTKHFKFLDKAAIVADDDDPKSPNLWALSTVHRVEELKSILRMFPIWTSGIILFTAYAQQSTFSIQQANTMDRHIFTPKLLIPSGSITVFTITSALLTIVLYNQILVPVARRFTGLDHGISFLQRMGIGLAISTLATLLAGFVEVHRKHAVFSGSHSNPPNPTNPPISVIWLVPQFGLHGIAEAFMAIGQLEFFYDQAPESMQSTASALYWASMAAGNYLSTLIVTMIHKYSGGGKGGGSNWLPDDDLNKGKLENFYWLLTVMQAVNLVYYIICAKSYTYKPVEVRTERVDVVVDVEDGNPL